MDVSKTARMMKMATSDGFPLRQGAGTGSRLVFCGYRGLFLRFLGFIGGVGVGDKSRGSTGP